MQQGLRIRAGSDIALREDVQQVTRINLQIEQANKASNVSYVFFVRPFSLLSFSFRPSAVFGSDPFTHKKPRESHLFSKQKTQIAQLALL